MALATAMGSAANAADPLHEGDDSKDKVAHQLSCSVEFGPYICWLIYEKGAVGLY